MCGVKALSLFSGIGGLDLAAEMAGIEVVGLCEIEPFPVEVLKKRFPGVPIFEDVRKLTKESFMEAIKKEDKYANVVESYERGKSIQQIADEYKVTRQAMWDILKRRNCNFRPNQRYGDENHFYRGGKNANDHSQNLLEQAIEDGKIERKYTCEKCGANVVFADGRTGIQAHHCDYNKPLEVMWLCQKCHHEWHKNNKAVAFKGGDAHERARRDNSRETIDIIFGGFPQ